MTNPAYSHHHEKLLYLDSSATPVALGGVGLYCGPALLHGDDATPATAVTPPAETAGPGASNQQALDLIHDATNRLFGYSSLQATVHELITIGPRTLEAKGSYVAGEFPRLRLEYQITVGNTQGTLIEVCDSQVLRTLREIRRTAPADAPATPASDKSTTNPAPTGTTPSTATSTKPTDLRATRRDVRKILEAVRKQGTTPEAVLQAQLGLGGIPALLASFERTMIFDTLKPETVDGRSRLIVEGYWMPEFKKGLSEQLAGTGRDPNIYLPERIRLEFDEKSLVPERILYLRRATGPAPSMTTLLSLEFRDVRINETVDPATFEITLPPEVQEVDLTDSFIQEINGANSPKAIEPPETTK